ncbi:hypothetical protein [Streptomyces sp. NPDC057686]|uniref:hypothetical protein n=1 Tax=Streptomyces sp. NPDC057686 TaxID=3346212 RepID=UPI0036C20F66
MNYIRSPRTKSIKHLAGLTAVTAGLILAGAGPAAHADTGVTPKSGSSAMHATKKPDAKAEAAQKQEAALQKASVELQDAWLDLREALHKVVVIAMSPAEEGSASKTSPTGQAPADESGDAEQTGSPSEEDASADSEQGAADSASTPAPETVSPAQDSDSAEAQSPAEDAAAEEAATEDASAEDTAKADERGTAAQSGSTVQSKRLTAKDSKAQTVRRS